MKNKEIMPLNNLVMGLNSKSKQDLSEALKISKAHLLRMVKNPGRITIDQATIIKTHLEKVYGANAVEGCFQL